VASAIRSAGAALKIDANSSDLAVAVASGQKRGIGHRILSATEG
jgi:hypothetical protein